MQTKKHFSIKKLTQRISDKVYALYRNRQWFAKANMIASNASWLLISIKNSRVILNLYVSKEIAKNKVAFFSVW